jgi:16S rRNA (cytidine1402-2'-O)-methyltransferase
VVATPIGNLGDITLRAVETLRGADRVVAEDTRRTRGLLSHLGISGKPVERLDAHASAADVARIAAHLQEGECVALVTDAGTPVVSDPGAELVRAAVAVGAAVVAIPGPCAAVAALSVSGLIGQRGGHPRPPGQRGGHSRTPGDGFRFLGFLPRQGLERLRAIELCASTPEPVILYESPQRIAETLADLARAMPDREALVARELTKAHEELLRGTLAQLAAAAAREWLGEITVVLGPAVHREERGLSDEDLDRRIDEGLARGRRARDLAEEIALETGQPRREVYGRIVARRG